MMIRRCAQPAGFVFVHPIASIKFRPSSFIVEQPRTSTTRYGVTAGLPTSSKEMRKRYTAGAAAFAMRRIMPHTFL